MPVDYKGVDPADEAELIMALVLSRYHNLLLRAKTRSASSEAEHIWDFSPSRADPRRRSMTWTVHVDRNVCMGSGMCVLYAAGYFDIDDESRAASRSRRGHRWTTSEQHSKPARRAC